MQAAMSAASSSTLEPARQLSAPFSADSAVLDSMEVEVEDSLLMDHEAPVEKTDADFFNGEHARDPTCTHKICAPQQSDHVRLPTPQILRTTSMTTT